MMDTLNINENVWVKLTDEGRHWHREAMTERYPMIRYTAPTEDAEGWSKWQLWCLMHDFGNRMYMGPLPPFGTEIRLSPPSTKE